MHGGPITQPHGCWEGSRELENSTCVCTAKKWGGGEHWTIMATMTSSYLVSGRPDCLERVQLPPCMEQDASGFSSFPSLSLFFHTSAYVCAFACAQVSMWMPEVNPWYLFSECHQPCSLSQSFSILSGTRESGWAGWPVSTGPPFVIFSFSVLGLCTTTSSLFLGGFWDHSQVFLLANQALY